MGKIWFVGPVNEVFTIEECLVDLVEWFLPTWIKSYMALTALFHAPHISSNFQSRGGRVNFFHEIAVALYFIGEDSRNVIRGVG